MCFNLTAMQFIYNHVTVQLLATSIRAVIAYLLWRLSPGVSKLNFRTKTNPFYLLLLLQVITNEYLKQGAYTLEHLGDIFPAKLHLRTPFDPKHKRVQGDYSS